MFALQIDEEKKTKKNAKRVFTFVSLLHRPFILFSKNGTIAMAYKKKQNERKRRQSVKKIFVVIVLMTSRKKKELEFSSGIFTFDCLMYWQRMRVIVHLFTLKTFWSVIISLSVAVGESFSYNRERRERDTPTKKVKYRRAKKSEQKRKKRTDMN